MLDTYDELYRRHFDLSCAWVAKKVPEADTLDVASRAWVNVCKGAKFRGESQFTTWLWMVVRNEIARYYEKHRPEVVQLEVLDKAPPPEIIVNGERCLESRQLLERTMEKIKGLSDRRREIMMRTANGETSPEIARAMRSTPSAVRAQIRLARRQLTEE